MPVFAGDSFLILDFLRIWFFGFRISCQENNDFGVNSVAIRHFTTDAGSVGELRYLSSGLMKRKAAAAAPAAVKLATR